MEDKWRIIAHFLVKYSVVKKIENEEPRSKLRRVFKEWTQATPKEINRWNRLKNVLNVLEEKVEIEKIENEFGMLCYLSHFFLCRIFLQQSSMYFRTLRNFGLNGRQNEYLSQNSFVRGFLWTLGF